jgi:hypothetical protein
MAVTLDYSLSPSFSRWATGVDLAAADETTLAYDCFCGGVTFVVEGADFSARWGWVTVLDFALSSTGSDEVKITASYTSDVVTVPATELHAASEAFLERVVAE